MFNPVLNVNIPFNALVFMTGLLVLCDVSSVQALELEHDLTDPTRPAAIMPTPFVDDKNQQTNNHFKVSQIYISNKNKMAIVNGQQVKMGDRVDGAEVLAIQSDTVELLIRGSITKISIMPSIKQYKN